MNLQHGDSHIFLKSDRANLQGKIIRKRHKYSLSFSYIFSKDFACSLKHFTDMRKIKNDLQVIEQLSFKKI